MPRAKKTSDGPGVVKNITDDPADIPSLGVFAVQPGDTAEVPDVSSFEGSEIWAITAKKPTDEGDAQ